MPQSKAKKKTTIERLRKRSNRTDLYQAEPGRSLEFTEQVKSDVEEILAYGMNRNIVGWGTSCKEAREALNYTYMEVAEILGVSHRIIQEQEKKNGPTTVDPFYLEAFSLIYRQHPHAMLGIPSPHLVCPLFTNENLYSKYCNVIMGNLYHEHKPEKLSYLSVITKIAKLTEPKYRILVDFLNNTKIIDSVFKINPLNDPKIEDNSWRLRLPEGRLTEDMRCSAEYILRYTFWDAVYALEDLESHNSERLILLAQMALADAQVANFLRHIMVDAEYPRDSKSLRRYNIEEIIISGAPSKHKRMRGVSL